MHVVNTVGHPIDHFAATPPRPHKEVYGYHHHRCGRAATALFSHHGSWLRLDMLPLLVPPLAPFALPLALPIFPSTLRFSLLLSHDVLECAPQRLDRRELVAHRDDGLEVAVELVDVGEDVLEALFVGGASAQL